MAKTTDSNRACNHDRRVMGFGELPRTERRLGIDFGGGLDIFPRGYGYDARCSRWNRGVRSLRRLRDVFKAADRRPDPRCKKPNPRMSSKLPNRKRLRRKRLREMLCLRHCRSKPMAQGSADRALVSQPLANSIGILARQPVESSQTPIPRGVMGFSNLGLSGIN